VPGSNVAISLSSRKNSSLQLPADAPAICAEFIRHVQSFIDLHNVNYENIMNMYQVPL
jgi:hypothetical protein